MAFFLWTHKNFGRFAKCFGFVIQLVLIIMYLYMTYMDEYTSVKIFIASEYLMVTSLTFGFVSQRVLIAYYFTFKYNPHPWRNITTLFHADQLAPYYQHRLVQTNVRIAVGFSIFMVIQIFHTSFWAVNYSGQVTWMIFDIISTNYAVMTPIGISQCVLSFILLKYELYLHTLCTQMDETQNIDEMFKKYQQLYKCFQIEYGIWNYIMVIQMLVPFSVLSLNIDTVAETKRIWDNWQIIGWTCTSCYYYIPIMEFFYASAKLNHKFKMLLEKLWQYSVAIDINEENETVNPRDIKFQSFFFQYVRCHEIIVRLFGMKVTWGNALKYIIAFVIAKIIGYQIYHIQK